MKIKRLLLAAIGLNSLAAYADWTLVTDFTDMSVDDLNRYVQNPGFGSFYLLPGLDPTDEANFALYADSEERGVRCNELAVAIPLETPINVGSVATLKFDIYLYGTSLDLGVGLSPIAIEINPENGLMLRPMPFNDFEPQMRLNVPLDVRDGSAFRQTTVEPPVGEWFTLYMVVDHGNQTTQGYLRREDGTFSLLEIIMPDETTKDNWSFRIGRQEPLISLFLTVTNSCARGYNLGDIWLIDNIYLDSSGKNLDGAPSGDDSWAGFALTETGWANTEGFLGWVSPFGDWVYVQNLGKYVYLPEASVIASGAWIFVPGSTPVASDTAETWAGYPLVANGWADTGSFLGWVASGGDWVYLQSLTKYAYIPEATVQSFGTWAFTPR